jgi:short subunit dehydrogenase-like uncharacterized protein
MAAGAQQRDHDIVVFGATGFVGELTAAYLAASAPAGTRIALAGRSQAKLERVRSKLGSAAADWPLVVADTRAQGDPGYKATGVMLGESGALALSVDEDRLPDAAGVLTPSTAMGTVLVDRLRAAGQSYDVSTRCA